MIKSKKLAFISSLCLSVGLMGSLLTACNNKEKPQYEEIRTLVFKGGDFDSKYYRIPAIVTAKDGSLVAIADKRIEHNGDLPAKIDIVSRRSTDNGKTWSEYITVAENDSIGGCGDAAVVVDEKTGDILAIFSHGNGLWQDSPAHITVVRSQDNGLTWGEMLDINPQIYTEDPEDTDKINVTAGFASSGHALQLNDGRIMFALVTRKAGEDQFKVYAVYSDDGGETWQVSKTPGSLDGDESKIVELADGTLIMSVRNRYRDKKYDNRRLFSYSYDRGETWTEEMTPVMDIIDPACNGDIIRYTYDGNDILLQSVPGSPNKRENVTIYASTDGGKTFPYKKQIVDVPSGYSSMTVLPDGQIGILIEEEAVGEENAQGGHGYDLWFTAVPLDSILVK